MELLRGDLGEQLFFLLLKAEPYKVQITKRALQP